MSTKIGSLSALSALIMLIILETKITANSTFSENNTLTIRILHTNDVHAKFEETSKASGPCGNKDPKEGNCYGGFARMATLIRNARQEAETTELPTFYFDAGDIYAGSPLYIFNTSKVSSTFMNILRPDVSALGNHDFDLGVLGLEPFLNDISYPVIATNLNLSAVPSLENSNQLKKSIILYAKNRKIGIVAYLTPETVYLANTENVKILDEVPVIQEEINKLKKKSCDIIIALGHSGYARDIEIAKQIEDIDLIIGGHSHTFLYSGPNVPDSEESKGEYPTVVEHKSGKKVYIVHAYAFTKYLGNLTIDFDAQGNIIKVDGKPILLDKSIPKAVDVETELASWTEPLVDVFKEVVGSAEVPLMGKTIVCRLMECNLGNLETDAMIYYHNTVIRSNYDVSNATIAIISSGRIRASIDPGEVTVKSIMTAFLLPDSIVRVNVTGRTMKQVLERSISDAISINKTRHGGCFLQVSGLKVTYDISKPIGERVVSAKTLCNDCSELYQDLDMDAIYSILVSKFLYQGGDKYLMLKNLPRNEFDVPLQDVIVTYFKQNSPVHPSVEGRITVSDSSASALE